MRGCTHTSCDWMSERSELNNSLKENENNVRLSVFMCATATKRLD